MGTWPNWANTRSALFKKQKNGSSLITWKKTLPKRKLLRCTSTPSGLVVTHMASKWQRKHILKQHLTVSTFFSLPCWLGCCRTRLCLILSDSRKSLSRREMKSFTNFIRVSIFQHKRHTTPSSKFLFH